MWRSGKGSFLLRRKRYYSFYLITNTSWWCSYRIDTEICDICSPYCAIVCIYYDVTLVVLGAFVAMDTPIMSNQSTAHRQPEIHFKTIDSLLLYIWIMEQLLNNGLQVNTRTTKNGIILSTWNPFPKSSKSNSIHVFFGKPFEVHFGIWKNLKFRTKGTKV